MAVELPSHPGPLDATPMAVDATNRLSPAFGGPDQEQNRPGSRWAFTFVMPPMAYVDAMKWSARLLTRGDTVVMAIPQPGFDTGSPGSPRVNGAAQTGNVLNLDGMTNGYVVREGQWLSVIISGQRFAYHARADVTVVGGAAAVPVNPLIRRSPADNAVVEIAAPKVEGFTSLPEGTLAASADRIVRGLTFTIKERE